MRGWKTKTAGVAAILGGAAMILNAVVTGEYENVEKGFMMAVGGLTALGLGHKLDKAKE